MAIVMNLECFEVIRIAFYIVFQLIYVILHFVGIIFVLKGRILTLFDLNS